MDRVEQPFAMQSHKASTDRQKGAMFAAAVLVVLAAVCALPFLLSVLFSPAMRDRPYRAACRSQLSVTTGDRRCFMIRWLGVRSNPSTSAM